MQNLIKFFKVLILLFATGTYNPDEGLDTPERCLNCSSGQFCNETGLQAPAGPCFAGYLCVSGAGHPGPDDGLNGPCPKGHYCLEGKKI